MARHSFSKGLRLPALGAPEQQVETGRMIRRVALLADDYVGLRPTMRVAVGESSASPKRRHDCQARKAAGGCYVRKAAHVGL